jgi:UDP-N-acetyl-alpha-D-muramoyl-L-alanyl-L-glutamate epimerase
VTRDLDQVRAATYRDLGGTADTPVFRVVGWQADGEEVALTYAIDGLGSFTEHLTFVDLDVGAAAQRSPAVRGALQLTLLTAALSYLKVCLPRDVHLGPAPAAAVRMVEALLTDGLAELAFDHDLDVRGAFDVHHEPADDVPVEGPAPDGVLVPVGGGKDSAVTAIVAARRDPSARTIAVNPRRSMHATADAVGLPLVEVRRRLDPRLFALNDAGAINGHVPITAIVSSICAVAAACLGRGAVLLSNERSADEPTRRLTDRDVNHQYSKSSAFEALHVAAAAALTGGAVAAWSFLRPASELLIARAFARTPHLLGAVNSCNRAYALNTERIEWCGDCPKCRFVQLTLAPFLDRDDLVGRLGFDALDDPAQLPGIRALVDPDAKPFECVGTIDEAQLALDLLADDPAWAGALAVRELGHAGTGAADRLHDLVATTDPSGLPEPQRTWFVEDVLGDPRPAGARS